VASVKYGVPDACTQCHQDKTDQWAADIIVKRTGRKAPYYPQTALLSGVRHGDAALLPALLAYADDPGRPAILRATMLLESGRFPSPAQLAAVDNALRSADPLLRTGAVAALANVDPDVRLEHLQALLTDPSKSVRMAVAQQLAGLPLSAQPPELRAPLAALFEEYRQSLLYNADMPESLSNLALLQAAQSGPAVAEKTLQRALRLAPRYLPAMLNLADIYREQSRDYLGETLLREAVADYPESADAQYMLGLLYVRSNRKAEAVPLLEKATQLAPGNAQYALVYALSLIDTGRRAEGINVLHAAARRFPDDDQIREAAASYR